jgi:hypothetical protein
MDITLILTVFFGLISIVALYFAVKESNKAKLAEKRIIDIEQAVVSYGYLKGKAYEYYNTSRYEESLDVFRKYFLDNKDEKEWIDVIMDIFKKETSKLFSDVIDFKGIYSNNVLIQSYISYEEKLSKSPAYPNLLKKLYEQYKQNFQKELINVLLMINLFDKNWAALKIAANTYSPYPDKDMNEAFKKFLLAFVNSKNTGDDFTDDIPF